MDRMEELLAEMPAVKKEKNLEMLFLAVVNIVELRSQLILCGPGECALAQDAFGGALSQQNKVMDLGKRVSRKKDFVPAISKSVKGGWTKPKGLKRGPSYGADIGMLSIDPSDPHGRITRAPSTDAPPPPSPSAAAALSPTVPEEKA